MDTSSAAAEAVTLWAAAGFVAHFFPTGQGNIIGNPIEPVIKLSCQPADRKHHERAHRLRLLRHSAWRDDSGPVRRQPAGDLKAHLLRQAHRAGASGPRRVRASPNSTKAHKNKMAGPECSGFGHLSACPERQTQCRRQRRFHLAGNEEFRPALGPCRKCSSAWDWVSGGSNRLFWGIDSRQKLRSKKRPAPGRLGVH